MINKDYLMYLKFFTVSALTLATTIGHTAINSFPSTNSLQGSTTPVVQNTAVIQAASSSINTFKTSNNMKQISTMLPNLYGAINNYLSAVQTALTGTSASIIKSNDLTTFSNNFTTLQNELSYIIRFWAVTSKMGNASSRADAAINTLNSYTTQINKNPAIFFNGGGILQGTFATSLVTISRSLHQNFFFF